MKRRMLSILFIATMLFLLVSCSPSLKSMDDGDINHNIYPYLKFELSEDRRYFTATVVEGAKVTKISVPGEYHTAVDSMPVGVFKGFENPEDAANLETITLDYRVGKIEEGALDSATRLMAIRTIGPDGISLWADIPPLKAPDGYHFLGWMTDDGVYISPGMPVDPEHSYVNPVFEEHKYEIHEGKEPTCTEKGWKEYGVCSVCRHSTYTELPPLGHEHTDAWLSDINVHYHGCERCDEKFDIGEHIWGEPVITLPPTETSNGIKTYTCNVCLYEKTEEIPQVGCEHSLIHHEAVEADCITGGNIEYFECSKCSLYFTDSEGKNPVSVIDTKPLGHDFDVESWGDYDDCYHFHVCSRCGALDEDSKEAHSIVFSPTSDGKAHFAQCSECGYENKEETKPHTYGEWIVDIAPIGESAGRHHRVCSVCNHSEYEDYRLGFLDISIDSSFSTLDGISIYVMRVGNTENEYQALITAPSEMAITSIEWQLDDIPFGKGGLTERFVIPGIGDHKVSFEALVNGSYGYAEIIFTIKEN